MNRTKHLSRPTLLLAALVLAGGLAVGGCDGLLDVDNPNNLIEEDLSQPTAAGAIAQGAVATVTQAYGYMLAPYATVSDELVWSGSRDAWNQLDLGFVSDPLNEFTDAAFPYVGEARWMADFAIDRLEAFKTEGKLSNEVHLGNAYHYAALSYLLIGDMFEDFALSDRTEPAPPIGAENMDQVYVTAIDYLDRALAIARAEGAADLEAATLAARARAKHGLAVWRLLNPAGSTPANPLVNDAGVNADIDAYFALAGDVADAEFLLSFGATTVNSDIGDWVNQRSEMAVTALYESLQDPVTGAEDPRTDALVARFTSGEYPPLAYVTARELHLLRAEAALAAGDADEAVRRINVVRDLGGVAAYDPDAAGAPAVRDLLVYERQANLFMMGRRLHDLYRFGLEADRWDAVSTAAQQPGTFFPITDIERKANPNIN